MPSTRVTRPRKSSRPSKSSKNAQVAVPDVADTFPVPVTEAPVEEPAITPTTTTTKRKRVVTKEEVEQHVNGFLELLQAEIALSKEDKARAVPLKTWRNLLKEAKKLKTTCLRASKPAKKQRVDTGPTGFMKPATISKELADFTGWDIAVPHSRVEFTLFLSKYIRENNLQNPENKREIFGNDVLAKLLNYDPAKETLTFPLIQRKMQIHFS